MKSISGKKFAKIIERHGWKLLRVTLEPLAKVIFCVAFLKN
jgi:hypothetical protein